MRFQEISENIETYDLQGKYDLFNAKYFQGRLPKIPLKFSNLKNVGGQVSARMIEIDGAKVLKPNSMYLELSNRWQRTTEQLDGLLMHEMIHVYFYTMGEISEQHGIQFRTMRRKLADESGIDIPLSDDAEDTEFTRPVSVKEIGVLLVYSPGKYSFTLMSADNARKNKDALEKLWSRRLADKVTLYTISSPIWSKLAASFPVARKLDATRFILKDQEAVDDLVHHGHVLFNYEK